MSVALTVAIITIIALIIVLIYVVLKYTIMKKLQGKLPLHHYYLHIVGGIIVIILIFYYQYLMAPTSSASINFMLACAVLGISLPAQAHLRDYSGSKRTLETLGHGGKQKTQNNSHP